MELYHDEALDSTVIDLIPHEKKEVNFTILPLISKKKLYPNKST